MSKQGSVEAALAMTGIGNTSDKSRSASPRENLLEMARVIISADRNTDYGEPERNFEDIAALWTIYKEVDFDPHDVAVMQLLVKVARIKQSPAKMDHWIDIAGYAACGGEVAGN